VGSVLDSNRWTQQRAPGDPFKRMDLKTGDRTDETLRRKIQIGGTFPQHTLYSPPPPPPPRVERFPDPSTPLSYLFSAITSVTGDLVPAGSLRERGDRQRYFNPRPQKIDIISTLTPLIVAGVELRKP